MANTENPVMVVGGGPAGLYQALYLAEVRKQPVILVEQQPTIGGMFVSDETPWGLVDKGVHIQEETGLADIDKLINETLPTEDWHYLEGARKDIAGNYFRGTLNTGAVYPDLRQLPQQDYQQCLDDIMSKAQSHVLNLEDSANLQAYFKSRFGDHATEIIFEPLAQKIWQTSLENLSPWAAKVVHLSRVVAHDHETALSLKQNPALDAVLGFPEQLKVKPEQLSTSRRAMYPKKFGLIHVVNGLEQKLLDRGVKILTNTKLKALHIKANQLSHCTLVDDENELTVAVSALVWTSPMHALLPLLNIKSGPPPDKPIPHRVVHLFLDKPPQTEALYWLWSFDTDNHIVRFSSQAAYCPDAAHQGLYPVCVETHIPDNNLSDEAIFAQVANEVVNTGLVSAKSDIKGQWLNPAFKAFMAPTLGNCKALANAISSIENEKVDNLIFSTANVSSGKFYLRDVLAQSLAKLQSIN